MLYLLLGKDAVPWLLAVFSIHLFIRCSPDPETELAGTFTTQPAVHCIAMQIAA